MCFINQLSNAHRLTYPKRGDFMVDDRYLFEIGNKIPLWLFGFLY